MKMCWILLISFCIALNVNAAPIGRRVVDLTYVFNENSQKFPPFRGFELSVVINGTQGPGYWLQAEEYTSTTHAGTHMDAPSHIIEGGKNIVEIPVENFIAPAAVIDITAKANIDPDAGVTVDDLQNWESTTGQSLNGKILLMRSGYGRFYGNRTAFFGTSGNDTSQLHFPGVEVEAAQWLVDNRNIYGFGGDTLSLDKGNVLDMSSHVVLLGRGIFILENVANLEAIPISGAMLYVMPMKLDASGAPTRIVATFPEVIANPQSNLGQN